MNKILIIEGDINNAINGFRKQLIESIKDKYEIVIIGTTTNKNINIPISTNSLKFYNLGKLSSNPIWLLFYLFKSIRIIVKENPILCLSFNLRPNILIGLICKFYPVKSIATITGTSTFLTNSNTFKNKLLQYIFKSINLIVFQNNNDKLMFDKMSKKDLQVFINTILTSSDDELQVSNSKKHLIVSANYLINLKIKQSFFY